MSVTKCCEVGAAANKHHRLAGPLIRGAAKSYLLKWICRGKRLTVDREEGRSTTVCIVHRDEQKESNFCFFVARQKKRPSAASILRNGKVDGG
jgi:hypothetical protein